MDLKVRAGMEMSMIDAASKSVGVPLWKLFVVLKRNLSAQVCLQILFLSAFSKLRSYIITLEFVEAGD